MRLARATRKTGRTRSRLSSASFGFKAWNARILAKTKDVVLLTELKNCRKKEV